MRTCHEEAFMTSTLVNILIAAAIIAENSAAFAALLFCKLVVSVIHHAHFYSPFGTGPQGPTEPVNF